MKNRGKRNISKYLKTIIKVDNKSVEIKTGNFEMLNKIKGKLQIENPSQNIVFDDVIGYLLDIKRRVEAGA